MIDAAEARAALDEFWALYRSIFAAKGLDVPLGLSKWSNAKRRTLQKYSADRNIEILCTQGCHELPLAALVAIIPALRAFETKWKRVTGNSRQRKQTIRAMEKAATALEKVSSSISEVIIEDDADGLIDTVHLGELRRQLVSGPFSPASPAPKANVPDLEVTIHALRTYSSFLRIFELSDADAGIHSADTLSKYLFSAYVYRATGEYHDVDVSALIGAALDDVYDETAHRMWRSRNYKRIDSKLSGLADMLAAFGGISAM